MAKAWEEVKEGRRDDFCFLKIDIVQHSQITRANRQSDVEDELNRFFETVVQKKVELHNGQVWSWQGDGGLCTFLDYDEKKVDHAVQCGIDIVKGLTLFNRESKLHLHDDIQVRIGVHLGQATYRENTGLIHSEAINFVSHLEERTQPNSIAISDIIRKNCRKEFQKHFKPVGDIVEGTSVYIFDKYGLGILRELKKIRDGVSLLIEKVNQLDFKPDLIVGVGRSGGIIAGMLAGNMDILSFTVMSRNVKWPKGERIVQPDDITQLNIERIKKEKKKILLVFVEIKGGATYNGFINLLRKMGIENFHSATLFISPGDRRTYPDVDYAYEKEFDLSNAPWVINEEVWKPK